MFLTDNQILSSLGDLLKYNASNLPSYWTSIVAEQHAAAYGYMVSKLLARGYTQAQIVQWDQGPYYERQLSLFFTITDATATDSEYDPKTLMLRDVRKELDFVVIAVNGAFIQPAATGDEPGTIGMGEGPSQYDPTDVFRWPDKHDLRLERW